MKTTSAEQNNSIPQPSFPEVPTSGRRCDDASIDPFSVTKASAVSRETCGVCDARGTLNKLFECAAADSVFATLYICSRCYGIYDATAENLGLDIVEWQKRWSTLDDFYVVPHTLEGSVQIEQATNMFHWFQDRLGVQFSGHYMEIGAGSGLMGAAALSFFESVNVFDHVQDRLLATQRLVGNENYKIVGADQIRSKPADCILIWHAMEHLLDPGRVFGLCAATLKPLGHLLIQVPILSREHIYPGHYFYYNEPCFRCLGMQWGLEVLEFFYDYQINAITAVFRKPDSPHGGKAQTV